MERNDKPSILNNVNKIENKLKELEKETIVASYEEYEEHLKNK